MKKEIIRRIIKLVIQAQELALKIGIPNILQPGLVKEMIIAETLGHELIHSKRDADACDPNDPSIKYEYLSCYEGGSGQLDRMFKEPKEEREKSLYRIWRNQKIFFAIFLKDNPLKIKVIYEIEPKVLVKETERQLDRSSNSISHVVFLKIGQKKIVRLFTLFEENDYRQHGFCVRRGDVQTWSFVLLFKCSAG